MTAASMQGDRPPDKAKHSWRCNRPPLEDYYTRDRNDQPVIRRRCSSCGAYEPEDERGGVT
jgi:hypothetical protein